VDETESALLPYQETTDSRYVEAPGFSVERAAFGVWILHGLCPRCAAQINVPVLDPVFGGSRVKFALDAAGDDSRPESDEELVPVLCTCTEAHPGRPAGAVGCGAFWNYSLPS
jgi:hypothetical protein